MRMQISQFTSNSTIRLYSIDFAQYNVNQQHCYYPSKRPKMILKGATDASVPQSACYKWYS